MIPQEPPTWEKLGIVGIAATLLTMLGLVIKTLIKGPAGMASQNKQLVERLIDGQDKSREQQERFHKERIAQAQAQHEVLVAHLEALMRREDRQDGQLDSLRGLLRRLSALVAAQKVTDPKDVMTLVDGVIAAGEVQIPGYERPAAVAANQD